MEHAPSLHNKYTSDTAYSQQVIMSFAQPAIDKRLLGATQSHQSDTFDCFQVIAGCRFNELEDTDYDSCQSQGQARKYKQGLMFVMALALTSAVLECRFT